MDGFGRWWEGEGFEGGVGETVCQVGLGCRVAGPGWAHPPRRSLVVVRHGHGAHHECGPMSSNSTQQCSAVHMRIRISDLGSVRAGLGNDGREGVL